MAKYPDICERSHFIFVPGPQDRHAPKIYPRLVFQIVENITNEYMCYFRAPLPPSINDLLKKRIRHLHLATNPVRLQYCTQEIVIFREDLLQKLCRYCIKLPSDNLPAHVNVLSLVPIRFSRVDSSLALPNLSNSSTFITTTCLHDAYLLGV